MPYLAPDDTELRALPLGLALVDVCDPLAEIESCLFPAFHALDLDERGIIVLIPLASAARTPHLSHDFG